MQSETPKEETQATKPGSPVPPRTRWQRICAYRRFYICAFTVFILDQITKVWIYHTIPYDPHGWVDPVEVIPGFFNIVHVGNTGAAWSLFRENNIWLGVLAAVALIGIFFFRRAIQLRQPLAQICFGLICGGILGNLVDRIAHGHVIDFLDFRFGDWAYPTFNIADCGICVGAILYALITLFTPAPKKQS